MSSRWLHLGVASLFVTCLATQPAAAQSPRSEREGGLLPPVIQVVSKQPIEDDEEIIVEVIKTMPHLKAESKAAEKKEENFKIIKVKKEMSDEPSMFLPKDKQSLAPTSESSKPTSSRQTIQPDKTMLFPEEKPVKLVKVPVREKVVTDEPTMPDIAVPDISFHFDSKERYAPPPLTASNVGWIDPALIGTQFRLRYDARFNNTTPDRAEYYTARNMQFFDGTNISGRGYPIPEKKIDMQEAVAYGEYAFSDRFSVFLELPARFMNPDQNKAANGLGDLNAGFKVAYFVVPEQVQTFQLRIYTPTGSTENGLGVGHATIEPGLLLWQKLAENWTLESEIRDWIPVGGLDYAGNTLHYSLGLSYDLYSNDTWSIKPVSELLGWSILRGKESRFIDSLPTFQSTHDANGTIIESAWGVRCAWKADCDWYLGYSFPLGGKAWFEHNLRLELRWHF